MDAPYAVQLVLPAQADSARLARLVAAALATDADWTIDETEDLRVAVTELFGLLVEGEELGDEQVQVEYRRTSSTVEVTGRLAGDGAEPPDDREDREVALDDLAQEILQVVVDEHELTQNAAGRQFHLVKQARKRT